MQQDTEHSEGGTQPPARPRLLKRLATLGLLLLSWRRTRSPAAEADQHPQPVSFGGRGSCAGAAGPRQLGIRAAAATRSCRSLLLRLPRRTLLLPWLLLLLLLLLLPRLLLGGLGKGHPGLYLCQRCAC